MSDLVDGRGCLTPDGLAAVAAASVGDVPKELASHLATCSRCQERLLSGGIERLPVPRRSPPSLGRMFLSVGAIVVAMVLFLVSMRWLFGR
jgi:hypothetical protein